MYCKAGDNLKENPDQKTAAKAAFNADLVKLDFPVFQANPDLIYFDNASTTQKPASVIETIENYYRKNCANAGRASYLWSSQLEAALEDTRAAVAAFLSVPEKSDQVVFTGGATDSLNTVTMAWALANLQDGDEVLLCPKDHKSAVLPWYHCKELLAAMGKHIKIRHFDIHEVGDYDLKSIKSQVSDKTRVLAMAHVHHVYGLDMEVSEIREIVGTDVIISLDASQSVGHTKVDANALPVDFISFSGHKMFAAPGTGVLYAGDRVKGQLQPLRLGGKSKAVIENDSLKINSNSVCEILESGTQNIPGILSLKPAIEYINKIGLENIEAHVSKLTVDLWQKLMPLPNIEFAPGIGICACDKGWGIISFRFKGISSSDLGFALDEEKIFVRTGDHCVWNKAEAEPDFLRVSMHAYNSPDDVEQFVQVLADIVDS